MSDCDDSAERTPESDVPEWPRPLEYTDDPDDDDEGRSISFQTQPSTRHPRSGKPTSNHVEYVDLTGNKARFDLNRLKTWPTSGGDLWSGQGQRGDEMLCRVPPAQGGTVRWVLVYITLGEMEELILTLTELESHPWGKNRHGEGPTDRELTLGEAAEWLERNEYQLPDDLDLAPPFDPSTPPSGRLARDWQPGQAPVERTPGVVLRGRSERPLVNGVETDCLNDPQYDVIKALLDAGESGLSKDRLIKRSGHTDAVNVLKRLAAKDPWRSVIKLAVQKGHRYRLAWTLPPDPTPNSTHSNTKQY